MFTVLLGTGGAHYPLRIVSQEPRAEPAQNPVLATVTRCGHVESWHRGCLVVVQHGKVVHAVGDVERLVFCRSATKPFQALPLLERGIAERCGFSTKELAVMVASHEGTQLHTDLVRGMLEKGGFSEHQLGCGPHVPFDRATAFELARQGERPSRLHNNCSGKHTGFLHLAAALGDSIAGYLDPDCKSQRAVRTAIEEMAEVEKGSLVAAIDGCGAPTYRLPLTALALAFARLTNPSGLAAVRARACGQLLAAIHDAPTCLAGKGQLTTELALALPGRIFPKNGAEGVYALGIAGLDLGLAVKIDDGNERAYFPVVVAALVQLGVLSAVPANLADFARVPVFNTQKKLVGAVEARLSW